MAEEAVMESGQTSPTDTKTLFGAFKNIVNSSLGKGDERPIVKILAKTATTLEVAIKAIDKFLMKRNINVRDAYAKSKEKGKSLLESAKQTRESVKERGILSVGGEVKSKIMDKFKSVYEKHTGPPNNIEETKPEEASAVKSISDLAGKTLTAVFTSVESIKQKVMDLGYGKEGAPVNADGVAETGERAADTVRENASFAKQKEKEDKRKAEIADEKEQSKIKKDPNDPNGKGGWLGKILGMGGMLLGGLKTIFGGLGKLIGKPLWGATRWMAGKLGGALWGATKWLGGFLFKSIGTVLGGALRGIQTAVFSGIGNLAKGALTAGRALLPGVLRVGGSLALRGAAMIATGPVGWAIAAGTAIYYGYKLYKYMTRNDLANSIHGKLTRLRLLSYGYNDMNKTSFSKLLDTEMAMKDYIKWSNGKIVMAKLDTAAVDKILEIHGVTRDDKEKYTILNNWFINRFIPAYTAHMNAFWYARRDVYLDDLDKYTMKDIYAMLTVLSIPPKIYEHTQIPDFTSPTSFVKKLDADELLVSITREARQGITNDEQKQLAATAKDNRQKQQQEAKQADANRAKTNDTGNQQPAPAAKPNTAPPVAPPDAEPPPDSMKAIENKTHLKMGKLNMASGDLVPGDSSLPGIKANIDKTLITSLDPNMLELFTGMAKEYNTLTGKEIPVNEAFRSYERQLALKKKYGAGAAAPGNSVHEFGIGIDIDSEVSKELDKMGLLRKYGFTAPVGAEPWHLEPIGVSLQPDLAKKDLAHRAAIISEGIGKGGGGYGFLPKSQVRKYGRNIDLQMGIWNQNGVNTIDIDKVASNSESVDFKKQVDERKAEDLSLSAKPPSTVPTEDMTKRPPTSAPQPVAVVAPPDAEPKPKPQSQPNLPNYLTGNSTPMGGSGNYGPVSLDNSKTKVAQTPEERKKAEALAAAKEAEAQKKRTELAQRNKENGMKEEAKIQAENNKYLQDHRNKTTLDKPVPVVPKTAAETNNLITTKMTPAQAIAQASQVTGTNQDTMMTIAKVESSLNPSAKAKTSSASGLFQFLKDTWDSMVSKYGKKFGLTPQNANVFDPYHNSLMGGMFIKENLTGLNNWKEAGIKEETAVYIAHFLGKSGANKFFKAYRSNPDGPSTDGVAGDQIASNKELLLGKTMRQFVGAMDAKLSKNAAMDVGKYRSGTGYVPPAATSETNSETYAKNTAQQGNTKKIDQPPPPTKPTAPAKPVTIGTAMVDTAAPAPAVKQAPPPQSTAMRDAFNTTNLESIMTDQLKTMTQVVDILKTINTTIKDGQKTSAASKFGGNQPQPAPQPVPQPQQQPIVRRTDAPDGIDLTRRKINA